ncbi:MAG: efflux RND transporter periplasmic adaptor subunit [Pseudomonadota bacterium]
MRASFALLGSLVFALAACADDVDALQDKPAKAVKLASVTEVEAGLRNSYPATIRSIRSTDLAFQVSGRITDWRALEGKRFRKGEVIARLDPRSFQNNVNQAEAEFRNAQSEYERAERLIDENAISQSVLESRLAQREVAEAALDTAKKDLTDTVLIAPFSGGVGRTYVEQFQTVVAQSPIVSLQSDQVEAIIDVPGSFVVNAPKLRAVEAFVELDAAPGQQFRATFREASGQADSSTQTFEAKFTFSPPTGLLVLNGMTARVLTNAKVFDANEEDASGLSVPLTAIFQDEGKTYVWVVEPKQSTISRRMIETASSVGASVIVREGLTEGETIVAAGGAYLNEGDKVRQWQR